MTNRLRRVFVLVAVACAMATTVASPAAGHSDDGTITAAGGDRVTGPSVRVEAAITFNSDGHAAPSATATVVAERSGAATVGPVPLKRDAATGAYTTTIELPQPGTWTLRYTSLSPIAVLERVITVDEAAVPTTAPPLTSSTVTTVPPTSSGVSPSSSAAPNVAAPPRGADRADDGGPARTAVLVAGIGAVFLAGCGFVATRSWRRKDRA